MGGVDLTHSEKISNTTVNGTKTISFTMTDIKCVYWWIGSSSYAGMSYLNDDGTLCICNTGNQATLGVREINNNQITFAYDYDGATFYLVANN